MNSSFSLLPGRQRVLTGMKPTGDVHLGNYHGAFRPAIDLSQDPSKEVILLCVDWHGLTNKQQLSLPGSYTHKIISFYLALGFHLEGNAIILQSDFPQILENTWYLACTSGAGLLERAHAYKDALANGKEPTAGLLYYPVLMSADIVTFDAQVVPVGKDQSQHLEYARDMVKLWNNSVGKDVYLEPRAQLSETPTLVGTDGRKMSKSYGNTIPVFAPKKEIEKAVKEIKTDSKGLHDPKDPETCLVFQIMKSFASPQAIAYMEERLQKGTNYGYGHAKIDFLEEHERVFGALRPQYEEYLNSVDHVKSLLKDGYERAQHYAAQSTQRARAALGLKHYY